MTSKEEYFEKLEERKVEALELIADRLERISDKIERIRHHLEKEC